MEHTPKDNTGLLHLGCYFLWTSFLTVISDILEHGHVAEKKSDWARNTGSGMIEQVLLKQIPRL